MATAIVGDRVTPCLFVEIHFTSGPVYFWSGIGPKVWNGLTFTGVGNLGSITGIPETSDTQAQGITLSLSGIPSDVLTHVLAEIRQGKPCRVWFGLLDSSNAIITDPYQSFAGRVDTGSIKEGGNTSVITITAENQLVDMHRSREHRYTDKDQQFYYPGDKGFEFVPAIQSWSGVWGRKSSIPSGAAGGGGSGGGPIKQTAQIMR